MNKHAFYSIKPKLILFAIFAVLFTTWLSWYLVNYFRMRQMTVLSIASQILNCPKDQIKIGPSYQSNDGPSEIPVEGCGNVKKVLCTDYSSRAGIIGQYFSFDLECIEEQKRDES